MVAGEAGKACERELASALTRRSVRVEVWRWPTARPSAPHSSDAIGRGYKGGGVDRVRGVRGACFAENAKRWEPTSGQSYNEHVSALEPHEVVVAADGSIPANQLAPLGIGPGAHLRVVPADTTHSATPIDGSLLDLPDLTWEDFERGSELARSDLAAS